MTSIPDLPDCPPAHPKKYRNRTAYNRALKLARESYWAKSEQDPNFDVSWEVYRARFIGQAMDAIPAKKPGPKPSANQTDRQRYQQVYQKARRKAMDYFTRSTKLRSEFNDFTSYWAAQKHTWLPDGFLKGHVPSLVPKRRTDAQDRRTAYQIVYHHYSRCWEGDIANCRERFGTWARYWEFVKANGFVPSTGEQDDIPPEQVVIYDNGNPHSDLHGKPLFDRIPQAWLPKPPLTGASPITRWPAGAHAVAVALEGDPEPEPVWA